MTDCKIAPYSPNVDGQIERVNATIKRKLGILTTTNGKPWSTQLPVVLHQYNTSVHSTTKASPMEALRGRSGTPFDTTQSQEELKEFLDVLHTDMRTATEYAAKRMTERHSKKSKVITFDVGDVVLCKDPKKSRNKDFQRAIYQYKATVISVGRSNVFKYRLKWGDTGGPSASETPGSVSLKYWNAKCMKLLEKAPPPTEIRSRKKVLRKRRKRTSSSICGKYN